MVNLYTKYTLLIYSAVCILACNEKPTTQSITWVADLTEEHFAGFTGRDIREYSALSRDANNGESIRIVPITDVGFNLSYELEIQKQGNVLMGNDYDRGFDTTEYFIQIDSVISSLSKLKSDRNTSVIFKVISEELNQLAESSADKRIIIINSDLMEKSFIDFYDKEIFQAFQNNPNSIEEELLNKYPLGDLSGIEVFLVYLPRDKRESDRFETVSGFYKNLLGTKGAKVKVIGSL